MLGTTEDFLWMVQFNDLGDEEWHGCLQDRPYLKEKKFRVTAMGSDIIRGEYATIDELVSAGWRVNII